MERGGEESEDCTVLYFFYFLGGYGNRFEVIEKTIEL